MNLLAVQQALRGPAPIERTEGVWLIEPLQFIPLHSTAVRIGSEVMFETHCRSDRPAQIARTA